MGTLLSIIPHKTFTFGKIWICAAHLEIRRRNIKEARKIFGKALGLSPKKKSSENILKANSIWEKSTVVEKYMKSL